jgi:hypothetical protein
MTVMRISSQSAPRNLIRVLIVVYSLTGLLRSENDACLSRTTLVGVSRANGEPPEGLTATDFKVTVGGKAASVKSATPADQPPRVILLVDMSADHDQSTWAATRALVDEFLAGFPEAGDFTLLTFDDKVERVLHEAHRALLQGILGEMFPSGKRASGAGLAEAVKKASASLDRFRQGDAEFLVTTSDQISKETERALSQERVAGIRLFGVSFDQSRPFDPLPYGAHLPAENHTPLESAAKASGGVWIHFDMRREDPTASLRTATGDGKSTAVLVRSYLALDLRLTSPITKPEKLKIELGKGSRGKAQDRLTYPQELFPCQ